MSEKKELILFSRRYYAISEVSEVTGFPMSTLRYLSNHFRKFFTPRRSSGEHRRFQAHQLLMLMAVKLLSDRFGMTTEGAQSTVDLQDARQMLEDGDLVVTEQVLNAYVIRSLQKRLNAFQGQTEGASGGSTMESADSGRKSSTLSA